MSPEEEPRLAVTVFTKDDSFRDHKEAGRLLRKVADEIDERTELVTEHHGAVIDANGNDVGFWSYSRPGIDHEVEFRGVLKLRNRPDAPSESAEESAGLLESLVEEHLDAELTIELIDAREA